MADIITTLHPEGAPEDDLYPNIKKENLPPSLQPVTDFAISEYEKTLQLLDGFVVRRSGYYDDNLNWVDSGSYSVFGVVLDAGTYTLSKSGYAYYGLVKADSSNTPTENIFSMNGRTDFSGQFTLTEKTNVLLSCNVNIFAEFMLNSGSTALPYQPYNGRIMHEIDVKGVKLWLNGNPSDTDGFADQRVTTASMSGYSKIAVVYGLYPEDGGYRMITYSESGLGSMVYTSNVYYGREFRKYDDTHMDFDQGWRNGVVNNARIIPLAIYGIK